MTKNVSAGKPRGSDLDDAPELTEAMLEDAEVFEGENFVERGRGRLASGTAKELVSIRLDQDVLAALRSVGPGWQTRVNGILRGVLGLDHEAVIAEGARQPAETNEGALTPAGSR